MVPRMAPRMAPLPVPALANLLVFDLELLLKDISLIPAPSLPRLTPLPQVVKVERIETPSPSFGGSTQSDEAWPTLRVAGSSKKSEKSGIPVAA
jgi:hypothetical protein